MIFKGTPETGFVHATNCGKCANRKTCKAKTDYLEYVDRVLDRYDENRPNHVNVDITCRSYFHKTPFDN